MAGVRTTPTKKKRFVIAWMSLANGMLAYQEQGGTIRLFTLSVTILYRYGGPLNTFRLTGSYFPTRVACMNPPPGVLPRKRVESGHWGTSVSRKLGFTSTR